MTNKSKIALTRILLLLGGGMALAGLIAAMPLRVIDQYVATHLIAAIFAVAGTAVFAVGMILNRLCKYRLSSAPKFFTAFLCVASVTDAIIYWNGFPLSLPLLFISAGGFGVGLGAFLLAVMLKDKHSVETDETAESLTAKQRLMSYELNEKLEEAGYPNPPPSGGDKKWKELL